MGFYNIGNRWHWHWQNPMLASHSTCPFTQYWNNYLLNL